MPRPPTRASLAAAGAVASASGNAAASAKLADADAAAPIGVAEKSALARQVTFHPSNLDKFSPVRVSEQQVPANFPPVVVQVGTVLFIPHDLERVTQACEEAEKVGWGGKGMAQYCGCEGRVIEVNGNRVVIGFSDGATWHYPASLFDFSCTPMARRIEQLQQNLQMQRLDVEGGHVSVVGSSSTRIYMRDGSSAAASGALHYLLSPKEPRNLLHYLGVDDYIILLEGGPVEYFVFETHSPIGADSGLPAEAEAARSSLAARSEKEDESPHRSARPRAWRGVLDCADDTLRTLRAPGGHYKALVLAEGSSYAWMVTVFGAGIPVGTIGAGERFLREFAGVADWATEACLRELIGPNFGVQAEAE